jgi:hypothetical protein
MSGAYLATHAAQRRQEKEHKEEEYMTHYRAEGLEEGWEFKIVRSANSAFRNSETLAAVLDLENLGGWELVEKFDDSRLRFRRLATAHRDDAIRPAGYDSYRTRYGMSEGTLAMRIVLIIFALSLGGVAIAIYFGA